MLLERGVLVSYETVRRWVLKFGPAYACRLRRKTPSRHDVWHLDEVVAPKRIITDKPPSYGAAKREIMPEVGHWSHKGLNNRAESSHVPLRKRERVIQGFRLPGGLQRFTTIFSAVRNIFVPPRSRRSALAAYLHRRNAMAEWRAAAGLIV